MTRRLFSIMHKEFLHMFRDPRTLIMLFLIPIVQLFLLAYEHVASPQQALSRNCIPVSPFQSKWRICHTQP